MQHYFFMIKNIGTGIKKVREMKDLTQIELSKITGINNVKICAYENNRATPLLSTLEVICNALNTSLLFILWNSIERDSDEVKNKFEYDINSDKIHNMLESIFYEK